MTRLRAHAPGRVNLIGDHTDYADGLALPMAIDLGTTIIGERTGTDLHLTSEQYVDTMRCALPVAGPLDRLEPAWSRYIAAVAGDLGITTGFTGRITSTLPIGAGLSSSASLELAAALALGFAGEPLELARLGQRAELAAVGVPCGLLDQLSAAFGREGHALRIDFATTTIEPIPLPDDIEIIIIHSGVERTLVGSAYAERREACERAAAVIGPLAERTVADLDRIESPGLRRRARHVITECARVRAAAEALRDDDAEAFGALMVESHVSLRDDFEVSLPAIDHLVDHLCASPGVLGARVTGAGFGGCVVAATRPGAIADPTALTGRGWRVRAAGPAAVEPIRD
ncbi:MAG: galactokinase [Acidobacteria bacterium]|nr:galactokinase [Acidobacteriota bacterium]